MIFCSQTNTCVTQWAAVSDAVHISYISCPYGSLLNVSLCMKSFRLYFYRHSTFSPHILEYISVNANMHTLRIKTHARSHANTLNTLTYCTHPQHSIHQSSSCVFFLPYLFTSALSLAQQSARSTQYTRARKCTQARTHKVARLVGAMAAALLRSPRVAPGARLPVVCQRLRVEFIQIKAVE